MWSVIIVSSVIAVYYAIKLLWRYTHGTGYTMFTYIMVAIIGIIMYFVAGMIFDNMDHTARIQFGAPKFEKNLENFETIKYNYMSNLTLLEINQNKLYNYSVGDNFKNINIDILEKDIFIYLKSLNQSKFAMNNSVKLMEKICISCNELIENIHFEKEKLSENNTISEYNPVRLIWNVYYIYAQSSIEEKCKSYSNILNSMTRSIQRILNIQRDFLQHTKFTRLVDKIIKNYTLTTQITNTQTFIDEKFSFEIDDGHSNYANI